MNLTLKNLKINNVMSEETTCFSATLYTDGKKVGTVENTGKGGCNQYHWSDKVLSQRVQDWASQQPTEFDFEKLDQIIDTLIGKVEAAKQLSRVARKKTLFRLKGDDRGNWRTVMSPYTPAVETFIVGKYGDRVECIANKDLEAAMSYC